MDYYNNASLHYKDFLFPAEADSSTGKGSDLPQRTDFQSYYYDVDQLTGSAWDEQDAKLAHEKWDLAYENYENEEIQPSTTEVPLGFEFENDDAAWVMACTFIIFSMQTGDNLNNFCTIFTQKTNFRVIFPI